MYLGGAIKVARRERRATSISIAAGRVSLVRRGVHEGGGPDSADGIRG